MNTCALLKARKEHILKRWEELSLAHLPEAKNVSRMTLRDHIPQVFTALCEALESGQLDEAAEVSRKHGYQRCFETDYSLSEVMGEYSLLKNVILDETTGNDLQSLAELRMIDKFFDASSAHAVTEYVAMREHELNSVTDSLVTLNSDLETFAAVAAHDLRSPASTIIGYADLISEEDVAKNELAIKAVNTIKRTANRMLELIDQLLDYSKIGKEHLAREIFSLKIVAEEARELLTAQNAEIGANITIRDLPDYNGDPILFRQLFQNLIANCLKFRDPSRTSEVTITATVVDDSIKLRIKDNGIGFDPKMSQEIFLPFKRAPNRPEIHGSGLGLATVKKIVELHGGKISASGQPGVGAEILIDLPQTGL